MESTMSASTYFTVAFIVIDVAGLLLLWGVNRHLKGMRKRGHHKH